tara:strand:- start:5158 stop:6864 length:1707 start_codon:yes stop_codon:yes gene_type:complete
MQPHNGQGQEAIYLSHLDEIADCLTQGFPANADTQYGVYTADQVRQQINFALQQGIRAKGYSHLRPSLSKSTIENLEASLASAFMSEEDIHRSFFGILSTVVTVNSPELKKLVPYFVKHKSVTAKSYAPDLDVYLKYDRSIQDWDWSQVDTMIRRLKRVTTLNKRHYSKAERSSAKTLMGIFEDFRSGRRSLEYIAVAHVLGFIQVRNVVLVDGNLKELEQTIPERGLDAPCLGRWLDMISRTVEGDNGNHRWKKCISLIDRGLLPPDFKMPFMLLTQQEARDCHAAYRMAKGMANIKASQAGTDRSDIKLDAEELIKANGWGLRLRDVDLRKNTLKGKKNPQVVAVRERMIDSHGGGRWGNEIIIRDVYNAIRDLKNTGDGKFAHTDIDVMKTELNEYIEWQPLERKTATFTHPGTGHHAGAFGGLGSEWRVNVIDAHNGTTENTYFLGSPMAANINNYSLVQVLRDTKHHGDVLTLIDNLERKFSFYRIYAKKVRAVFGEDAALQLPAMVAVPNFFTKDVDIDFRGKKVTVKSQPEKFIMISRNDLEEWVLAEDTLVPFEWMFEAA